MQRTIRFTAVTTLLALSTSACALLPRLIDSLATTPVSDLLSLDSCRIADVTPESPNGFVQISSGFPLPDGAVPQLGSVSLRVIPVETTDFPMPQNVVDELMQSLTRVSAYYREQSFGQMELVPQIEPTTSWVRLPGTAKDFNFATTVPMQDHSSLAQEVLSRWTPANAATEDDLTLIVLPPGPSASIAQAAGKFDSERFNNVLLQNTAIITADFRTKWSVISHEIGHTLMRLEDLYEFGVQVGKETYTAPFDLMSMAGFPFPLLGWSRWRSGWIGDGSVRCVPMDRTTTHGIVNLQALGNDPKLVVVPVSSSEVLVAELRTRIVSSVPGQDVVVYSVNTAIHHGQGPIRLIGNLSANGQSLRAGGVVLALDGIDFSSAAVTVSSA